MSISCMQGGQWMFELWTRGLKLATGSSGTIVSQAEILMMVSQNANHCKKEKSIIRDHKLMTRKLFFMA